MVWFFFELRNTDYSGCKEHTCITVMHLLLSFVMHTVELVETEETRGQDYQGDWKNNKDVRLVRYVRLV